MNIFQLEERVRENPDSPLITRLAAQYLIRGKVSDAVELLLKCIKLFPDYSTSYVILARCYASKKRYAEALLCSKKTFSLQPDSFILKNLIPNWEKLSSENEEIQDSAILPDLDTLKNILFKEYELHKPLTDDVFEPDKEMYEQQVLNQVESIEQEISPDAKEESLKNYDNSESQTVIEFIDKDKKSIPQGIETAVKNMELDEVEIQTEKVIDSDIKINEIQIIEEASSSKDVVKQPQNLEQLIHGGQKDNLSEVQQYTFQDQNNIDIKISEDTSSLVSKDIIEEKVTIEGAADLESEHKVKSQDKLTSVDSIKKATIEDDNIKKSDEHITKILESAHETLRKEAESLQARFNNEQVPELPQIVSATLAEIYVRQGEYEEAIKTYKALIKLRPKQKETFEKKIEELEKKLKSLQ